MKRQAAEAEGEAAEIGLLASRRNGPSQQINAPTINTTTADVCGSTADPVKGGEKELGIQDEENRKSKGTLPVINWSAGSKDSIQDETKSDTYISNYDETTGHERDELKEADLETGNKRVPATFGKQTRKQLRSSHKRRRSLESKERELGDDNHITKGDELKVVLDHLETENKRVPSSSDLEGELIAISSSWKLQPMLLQEKSCSARSRWREPNPGIKRPPVTVLQTPPPPPPPLP